MTSITSIVHPYEEEQQQKNKFYRIYESTFEAGHFIEGHPKCGVQHGHSYRLSVNVEYENDSEWVDFADIKVLVDEYVQIKLDHQFLGNASAEKISREICNYLASKMLHGEIVLYETSKFGIKRTF